MTSNLYCSKESLSISLTHTHTHATHTSQSWGTLVHHGGKLQSDVMKIMSLPKRNKNLPFFMSVTLGLIFSEVSSIPFWGNKLPCSKCQSVSSHKPTLLKFWCYFWEKWKLKDVGGFLGKLQCGFPSTLWCLPPCPHPVPSTSGYFFILTQKHNNFLKAEHLYLG